jgi:hypothetical protein
VDPLGLSPRSIGALSVASEIVIAKATQSVFIRESVRGHPSSVVDHRHAAHVQI